MKKSEALRILGISEGASDDAIKAAHRKKVVENHPDRFAHNSAEYEKAEEKTKLINEARDVLLSRKWEPEYVRRGPYANPYGSSSSGGYPGTSGWPGTSGTPGQGGNPYGDWPFGQGQSGWVWTSWDGVVDSQGQPFDPFGFGREPEKTPQERKEEASKELRSELLVIAVKLAGLVVFSLLGSLPTGLFLYVLVSVAYGLWKRLGGCLAPFIIPIAFVLVPFMMIIAPRAGAMTFGLVIACVLAFLFDIRNVRTRIETYRIAKAL